MYGHLISGNGNQYDSKSILVSCQVIVFKKWTDNKDIEKVTKL